MTAHKVLVVDDEENVRMTLAANLELNDYAVVEAVDGQDAVEKVRAEDFDAVIMDIRMPNLDGVNAYRAIRKIRSDLPVLLVTGFERESLINEACREGIYTVLYKPLDPEHILSIVNRAIRSPVVLMFDQVSIANRDMVGVLRENGVHAALVSDRSDAIERINDGTVDVCVLELDVPESGETVLREIKSLAPDVKVVLCSDPGDQERVREALALGGHTFLSKPFDASTLLETLCATRATRS